MSMTMGSRVTQCCVPMVTTITCVYCMSEVGEVVGSDEIGTGVKASKPSALAPSGGVCELTESTQPLARLVATFEIR